MFIALVILIVFLFFFYLMWRNILPTLIAIPLMALFLVVLAGLPYFFIISPDNYSFFTKLNYTSLQTFNLFSQTISLGLVRLSTTISVIILAGIFAQFLKITKVGENIVKQVAEFSSDNIFAMTFVLTITVSLLFSSLSGLGSIILIGNLYLPILLTFGIPPLIVASLFLMAISFGGVFNMINWQFYVELLHMNQVEILKFVVPFSLIFLIIIISFIFIEFKKAKINISWRAFLPISLFLGIVFSLFILFKLLLFLGPIWVLGFKFFVFVFIIINLLLSILYKKFNFVAYFSPFLPICLVLIYHLEINTAFLLGLIFLLFSSLRLLETTGVNHSVKKLSQAMVEGAQATIPAVVLVLGIGMLLIAVTSEPLQYFLTPLISLIVPQNKLWYLLFFTVLAPLALYRGPFNLWGMGSGLLQIIKNTGLISNPLIMSAFFSTGQIQGVCDPTNTYNVWIADKLKVDLSAILKKTLPYIWVLVFLGLLLSVLIYD